MTTPFPRRAAAALVTVLATGALSSCSGGESGVPADTTPATATASAAATPAGAAVTPGIEVLISDSLGMLRDKRVGLITNHSGRDRAGTSTIDRLHKAPGVRLTALYGPEHGLRGAAQAGEKIASSVDSATGVPIHSLYGDTHVPTPAMLRDVDVLVYDIQDVGARVYTYQWTMALAAEAAGKLGKKFVVLDRPNPIRADRIEGGVLDPKYRSFVGQYPVALRYGLTPGELMRYLVGTGQVKADVSVVPMKGYRQSMWWEDTGLAWVNPSPNLRDMEATALYPGTVFFEGVNLSEGRGTDEPFKIAGAPWLTDAGAIASALNAMQLPGVRFDSTSKTVEAGFEYGGQTIPVLRAHVTDRDALRPVEVGAQMLRAIYTRHRQDWRWFPERIDRLSGNDALRRAVEREGGIEALFKTQQAESERWAQQVAQYRLYPT
jgi:uncharacterized protein YbbC (DUF1343 family)